MKKIGKSAIKLAIVLILLRLLPFAIHAQPQAKRKTAVQNIENIRMVDFKNFSYQIDSHLKEECNDIAGLAKLRNGRFKRSGATLYFVNAVYGDLTGDGKEEALVILGSEPVPNNNAYGEVYLIYTLEAGQAKLVSELTFTDLNSEYQKQYKDDTFLVTSLGGTAEVALTNGTINIKAPASECHACEPKAVKFDYRLKDAKLMLMKAPARD